MPPRNPLCPYVVATVPGVENHASEFAAFPGVKVKGSVLTIPHHAVPLVNTSISRAGLPVTSARWATPAHTSQPSWPEVEPSLRANGAREFLFDGFLTDYQKDAVCFGFRRFGVHYWHTTGAGKTLTALLFALSVDDGPIVIVTRAASRLQYGREVERFTTLRPYVIRPAAAMKKGALTLAEYCADRSSRRVVVVGWESLADHIEPLVALRPGCVVFDECFIPGTKVQTERGSINIEDIVPGMLVLSVNTETQKKEYKTVLRVIEKTCKPESRLVRVVHEQGSFVCTPNHKIWTENGYVEAGKLVPRTVLCNLREQSCVEAQGRDVLFTSLYDESGNRNAQTENHAGVRILPYGVPNVQVHTKSVLRKGVFGQMARNDARTPRNVQPWGQSGAGIAERRSSVEAGRCAPTNTRTYADSQPDGEPRNTGAGVRYVESKWAQTQATRWEGARFDGAATAVSGTVRVADRIGRWCTDRNAENTGHSVEVVRDRYLQQRSENRHRSGRAFAPHGSTPSIGRNQGLRLEATRVVRVEVYERSDFGGLGNGCSGDRTVYDLEVADNHNYFADGILVSNCHKAKSNRRFEAVPFPETEDLMEQQAQAAAARARGGFVTQTETSRIMMVPTESMAASAARLARASKRRACTTATPVKDRVRDLWSQLDLAEPDAWGNATCWMTRYCLVPETPVLMGDGTYRPIGEVKEGDEVIGWSHVSGKRTLHRTRVVWTGRREAEVVQLRMESGRSVICTRDHSWLQTRNPNAERQYRPVFERTNEADREYRRKLLRLQPLGFTPAPTDGFAAKAYKIGYLRGALDGDGHTRIRKEQRAVTTKWGEDGRRKNGKRRLTPRYHSLFFNGKDTEHLTQIVAYLRDLGFKTTGVQQRGENMHVVGVHGKTAYRKIMCSRQKNAPDSFRRGWLAGMYDAEGSYAQISQYKAVNPETYDYLHKSLGYFGFDVACFSEGVTIRGGRWELLRFYDLVRPALRRKVGAVFARHPNFRFDTRTADRILSAFPLEKPREVVSIQTETGNYIAAGYGSKNCDRKPGTYGGFDTTGASNVEELADRLTYVVHRVEYAVTHRSLPPKRRQSVYVAPEDQCKPTGSFQKELNEASKRGPSAVMEVELALAASKKRKAVVGLVEDHLNAGQKVIIFTGRRRDCDELGKSFKGTKAQVWASHGGDSTAVRQQVVDDYMAHPGPCLLVGTGDAFGEALNLHDTDALLFVMLPWTPGQVRQWEGRVARLGQKRPVTIYYVIAEGTVDEHVASLLIDKMPAVESIAGDKELGAARSVIAGTEDEETLVKGILDKLFASEGEGEGEDE